MSTPKSEDEKRGWKIYGIIGYRGLVILMLFAGTMYIDRTVRNALKEYIPKFQYENDKLAHEKWSLEALKSIELQLSLMREDTRGLRDDVRSVLRRQERVSIQTNGEPIN